MQQIPLATVALALCSAFLFALSSQLQHLGLREADARSGAIVSIGTSALSFAVFAPFYVHGWYWLTTAAALFAMVGIFRPSLSATLALTGIQYMGPTLTTALTASSPIFAAIAAVAILGEELRLAVVLGTLAVVAGCVVATLNPKGLVRSWPIWAISLPLGAAFIRATGHAFTKIGLGEVASPAFAVLVGNGVSLLIALGAFKLERRRFAGGLVAYRWFVAAGLLNGVSLYALNAALQMGKLSLVAPVVASSPVFSMLLGTLVFRHEAFSWRTAATIGLVVPGVVLVVLR